MAMDDLISRLSIKKKLQEQHDFFIKAYGGFNNLPGNDKSRVDEITNCIAMVVNEPSVQPEQRTGKWRHYEGYLTCSECDTEYDDDIMTHCADDVPRFCPNCGAKMEEGE